MSASLFRVDQLRIEREGRPLFAPLSFDLQAGEALHLQGDNGAGKTSLLRALCGLSGGHPGEVRWADQSVTRLGPMFRREVFYLGHALGLKDELSALENLQMICAIADQPLTLTAAHQALQDQGLGARWHRPLRVLSQGQKRRVVLARLQVTTARLWLLDEPWVALDTAAQSRLTELIHQHMQRGGLVIYTSHQAMALGAHVHVKAVRLQP